MWACFYKIGVDPTDPKRWLSTPYVWFHVAPTQPQSLLIKKDIDLLIRGDHLAQKRPSLLGPFVKSVVTDVYYHSLEFSNGAQVQFRTTDENAKALLGYRANGISFDECAFEMHLKAVINETLLMRLISTAGPLLMVSTPNGINDFYEIVQGIIDRGRDQGNQTWITDDGWALVRSTVHDNVGFGLTQRAVDDMESNLDPETKEQQLRGEFLAPSEAFFSPPAPYLACFRDLPVEQRPENGHRYVIFWDPSSGTDPTAAIVLDVTSKPWVGVKLVWKKGMGIEELFSTMFGLHATYNATWFGEDGQSVCRSTAITGYDSTAMGGQMVKQAVARLTPSRGVNFAGPTKKMDLMTNLRAAMAKGLIWLPQSGEWSRVRREVMNYRLKDEKIRQDTVMALAGAAEIAAHGYSGVQSRPFDVSGQYSAHRR